MKPDQDGKPLCGSRGNELGVRPGYDLEPNDSGEAIPESGGLSTTPDDPALMPPHVRPTDLGGRGKLPVFVIDVSKLQSPLTVRPDRRNPTDHAFIEPDKIMNLDDLQELLCRTRSAWENWT